MESKSAMQTRSDRHKFPKKFSKLISIFNFLSWWKKNPVTNPNVCNTENVVEHQIQIEGQNRKATSNQTQPVTAESDACNTENVMDRRIQIEGQNQNALLIPKATCNQTQPLTAEIEGQNGNARLIHRATSNRIQAVTIEQSMDSRVEIADRTRQVDVASRSTQRAPERMPGDDDGLKKGVKITICATTLSGAGLIAIAVAIIQSGDTIAHHKHFLSASMLISLCVSFICGVLMLILWGLCHGSLIRIEVLKTLMWGCIVWVALGAIFGVAFCIRKMF